MTAYRSQFLILSTFAIGLAIAGWIFLGGVAEGNSIAHGAPGELQSDVQFGQTFVASHPDLYRIDVMMSTYGRRNTHDVIFHLKEGLDAQTDILSITFNASDVRDERWQSFTFPPIPDSAGRSFYFYLESPASELGNAVSVMGRNDDLYPGGQGFINNHPTPGDMTFRIFYRMSLKQKTNWVLESLSAHKPSVWGSKKFYTLLAILYVLLLGTLLWQISDVNQ